MKAALVLLALTLSACSATVNGPGAPIRQDGRAMLGQPTRVGQLVVTPMKLVEDSRCPMNARCVWAGRAIVTTRIDGAGWRETTNMELGRPYVAHGIGVQLSSVQPDKMVGQQQQPQAYLFGFTGG
jgi:predicted small secreted protein